MRRTNWVKGIVLLLCAASLAGCGMLRNSQTSDEKAGQSSEQNGSGSTEDGNALLDGAILEGSVLDFSDGSFQVLPVQQLDGGETAQSAAPGMEKEEDAVTVLYGGDCTFQIADIVSGRAELTDAGAGEVKKQTDVAVFGEKLDSGEIQASRILIVRMSGADGTGGN